MTMRGLAMAGLLALGAVAFGGAAAAQTSEVHMQGHQCRNLGKSNKLFDKNYYIYFETNSSRIDPKYDKEFARIVKLAKGQNAQQICVFGKASKIGNQQGNINLSNKRAQNVAAALEAQGWPRSKMVTLAEGEAWGWLEETLTWDSKEDRRVRIRLSR
ncbi:OmpA/MotB domain protein [Parvibaculum lavamentivorans DS-1]|uniref:OmpA/MotB domain protein n=1 Tax=Parvibaculum lavamentivorans (strain DS-1 / DSM 13023 / NCIMB 13966) TaxID=402881 RepID=A7HRD7_PARL1|nr:OmpA family protein [Parvibaculum lavamentivorans]ABS62470.1 OmpA/MotB domain protein [Parvibaculum lavamentivorans DS-1]